MFQFQNSIQDCDKVESNSSFELELCYQVHNTLDNNTCRGADWIVSV